MFARAFLHSAAHGSPTHDGTSSPPVPWAAHLPTGQKVLLSRSQSAEAAAYCRIYEFSSHLSHGSGHATTMKRSLYTLAPTLLILGGCSNTRTDWGVVTGISSAVIALCALVFSFYQGALTRKHNRLSFRPHLTTWRSANTEKGFYSIEIINNGIGPAIIEEFIVSVDGKRIAGTGADVTEAALKTLFPDIPYRSDHSFLDKGYSMAPKERCAFLEVQFLGKPLPSEEFVKDAMGRGDLKITYKSFYDETFHYFSTKDEKSSKPS